MPSVLINLSYPLEYGGFVTPAAIGVEERCDSWQHKRACDASKSRIALL